MKHLLLTTIAAVVLVGCGESPNELLHQAVIDGNIEAVKQHIAAGADVNAKEEKYSFVGTPLDLAIKYKNTGYVVDLIHKHGGKTGEELKTEGK